jgi:hypothetical protein
VSTISFQQPVDAAVLQLIAKHCGPSTSADGKTFLLDTPAHLVPKWKLTEILKASGQRELKVE